jgi:hypothetical protein
MFLNFVLDSLTVLANMVRIVAVLGDDSGLRGCFMKCVLLIGVDGTNGGAFIARKIDLPFFPIPGMGLSGVSFNPKENTFSHKVKGVEWIFPTEVLDVYLDDYRSPDETLEDVILGFGEEWSREEFHAA